MRVAVSFLLLTGATAFVPSCHIKQASGTRTCRVQDVSMTLLRDPTRSISDFLRDQAGVEMPECLPALMQLLTYRGEDPVDPSERTGLHPFVVPLTRSPNGDLTCLLRWPTPPESAPLPVVRTRPGLYGLDLVSQSPLELAHRFAVEEDAKGGKEADWAVDLVNQFLPESKKYTRGGVDKLGYGVERFLFLKVGHFPDVFDFLADFHLKKGDQQSALVTAEKAYSVFKGWGQPYGLYCRLLAGMDNREQEARDAALVALRTPLWTISADHSDIDLVIKCAKSDREKARAKYWKLYEDERLQEIKQGKRPEQVALDRAAFLMDAALLGADNITSWTEVKDRLASLYDDARMTQLATFVRQE